MPMTFGVTVQQVLVVRMVQVRLMGAPFFDQIARCSSTSLAAFANVPTH